MLGLPARFWQILIRVVAVVTALLVLVSIGAGIYVAQYFARVQATLPAVSKLDGYEASVPTTIVSRDGVKIGELFEEKRYPVRLSQVSPLLQKAFLAAEDARFFEHGGVDYQSIVRAGINYLLKSGPKQGGSTITQQLAKNLLLSKERTIERKVKDILLAEQIEKSLKKDQILELYLNTIFLGNNSYGVESAARNYFRKNSLDLNLAEASMIAGLAPAPSAYAPTENLTKAKTRQKFVLEQMVRNKWATKEEALKAYALKLQIHLAESPNTLVAPYFMTEVKKQLETTLNLPGLTSSGYVIHTTLDMKLQRKVQAAVLAGLKVHETKKGFRGPLKRHGANYTAALKKMLNTPANPEEEEERAIVVDLYPNLDAVAVVSQHGLGLLISEDHKWALKAAGKKTESRLLDFANILAVGDEVHVKMLDRGSPKRITANTSALSELKEFVKEYPQAPLHNGVKFYQLTDTEGLEAAALIMDSRSGEILAMVGGENFNKSEFNRTTQAKRQVGSSVKPLYYAYAQDQGFSPVSKIDSPPIVIGDWKPENYSKEFTGRTTMRTSLIHSYNISSIQLYQALGLGAVGNHLRRLGFDWPAADLSIALGAGDATLLQLVQAYSPFANDGRLAEAVYITKIEDRKGKVLYETGNPLLHVLPLGQDVKAGPKDVALRAKANKSGDSKNSHKAKTGNVEFDPGNNASTDLLQVLSPEAAYVSARMMQDVVRFGTGTRAAGVPHAAGKTGTTNGYSDAWFLGVVPNLVGGVWVGFDDARKSLGTDGTGGKMAAPFWRAVMMEATAAYPSKGWKEPANVTTVRVSTDTGDLVFGSGGLQLPVVSGTEPGSGRNALGMFGLSGDEAQNDENNSAPESSDTSSLRSIY